MHRRTIGFSVLLVLYVMWSGAAFAATDASGAMPSAMDERVRACTSCHGVQGQGLNNDYFPRIAGKPADYLFNQLSAFRDGGRTYPPMGYLLAFLPDDYLRKISQYFADLQPPYPECRSHRRRTGRARSRTTARHARRPGAQDPGVHRVSWRTHDGHAAWHSGPAWPACELHRRADGHVALGHTARACAGLHAFDRRQADRQGHHRGIELARAPAAPCRSTARAGVR